MNHGDRRVLSHRETLVQLRDRVHLSPGYIVAIHVTPAHRCDMRKPLRECSVHETKDPARRCAANRTLHQSRRGRRADINGALRPENWTKAVLKLLEQLLEFRSAVWTH